MATEITLTVSGLQRHPNWVTGFYCNNVQVLNRSTIAVRDAGCTWGPVMPGLSWGSSMCMGGWQLLGVIVTVTMNLMPGPQVKVRLTMGVNPYNPPPFGPCHGVGLQGEILLPLPDCRAGLDTGEQPWLLTYGVDGSASTWRITANA